MLGRRGFLELVAGAALAAGTRPAQATGTTATGTTATGTTPPHRVFMVQWRGATDIDRGMKDYLARANLPVDYIVRDAAQNHDRLKRIVEEIRDVRPDLVYAVATESALGVLGPVDAPILTDIPVVFAAVGDPLAARLVHGLPLSGRKATGVIHLAPIPVQYEAIHSLFSPRTLAVLYNAAETYGQSAVAQLSEICRRAGVDMIVETPLGPDGKPRAELIRPALERLAAQKPDALYLPSTSFFIPLSEPITEAATALGLPTFSANEPMIRKGKALAGLVASFYEVGQFAGYKIEQVLTGKKPVEAVPVESLSRFSLLINMEVARSLKVYPPITMLRYAEVIHAR